MGRNQRWNRKNVSLDFSAEEADEINLVDACKLLKLCDQGEEREQVHLHSTYYMP